MSARMDAGRVVPASRGKPVPPAWHCPGFPALVPPQSLVKGDSSSRAGRPDLQTPAALRESVRLPPGGQSLCLPYQSALRVAGA